jgi:hypothetical protein
MQGIGCAVLILVLLLMLVFQWIVQNPWSLLILAAAIALGVFIYRENKAAKKIKDREGHSNHATRVETLAHNLRAKWYPPMTLRPGETVIYHLSQVRLNEYRSNGSTYSGTSNGLSFRVTKNVRYNTSVSQGNITKKPEVLQTVDTGSATFTNQRVIYTGEKYTREWNFDKLLNAESGPNGSWVRFAVSNRQTVSGLGVSNYSDIMPGMLAAIAYEWFEKGESAASRFALDTAARIRAIAAGGPDDLGLPENHPNY